MNMSMEKNGMEKIKEYNYYNELVFEGKYENGVLIEYNPINLEK